MKSLRQTMAKVTPGFSLVHIPSYKRKKTKIEPKIHPKATKKLPNLPYEKSGQPAKTGNRSLQRRVASGLAHQASRRSRVDCKFRSPAAAAGTQLRFLARSASIHSIDAAVAAGCLIVNEKLPRVESLASRLKGCFVSPEY